MLRPESIFQRMEEIIRWLNFFVGYDLDEIW